MSKPKKKRNCHGYAVFGPGGEFYNFEPGIRNAEEAERHEKWLNKVMEKGVRVRLADVVERA